MVLSRFAMVELEQSAEAAPAFDRPDIGVPLWKERCWSVCNSALNTSNRQNDWAF
jgi:hypothetical protein